MKKYIICISIFIMICFAFDYLYFYRGDIYIRKDKKIECISYIKDNKLYDENNKQYTMKGIKISSSYPGNIELSDDILNKDKYIEWLNQISDLGSNTISVIGLQSPEFYEAVYEYNISNHEKEIKVIQGIDVDEEMYMSNIDAFDKDFNKDIEKRYKEIINAVHGNLKKGEYLSIFKDKYKVDVSQWVYSYVLYSNWDPDFIQYTNKMNRNMKNYKGEYLYVEDSDAFEVFLASIGDKMIKYESEKYAEQRNISFTVYANTDPLEYEQKIKDFEEKYAEINLENIKKLNTYESGIYASYVVYPYSPEYNDDGTGKKNLYREYIQNLNNFHNMPVVVAEYGVPSSRGIAAYESNRTLKRDYGNLSEKEQGEAIISMYKDIMETGSSGCIINNWQDEWENKTWNTIPTIDINNSIYWSDVQTNEQFFGLLSFDPGKERSKSYNDGDKEEWKKQDMIVKNKDYDLYSKYDEKYIYYMIDLNGKDAKKEEIFIPIDITPKTGSKYISEFDITADRDSDFVICIDGENNSKVLAQERYNTIDGIYGSFVEKKSSQFINKPEKDSSYFTIIKSILYEKDYYYDDKKITELEFINRNKLSIGYYSLSKVWESGRLLYGNGNPESKYFNSLSDFCFGKDCIEIRIPWQLLNFYNPSKMEIHDDYYECYGVEPISIDSMYVGVGNRGDTIKMEEFPLEGWGKKVTYHERLKESYYILKDYWSKN